MIKFVVIGMGYIGKRHADMINDNINTELVGIVDTNNNQLNDYINNVDDKYKNVTSYSSISELISSNIDYDVACICTPNGLHYLQSKLMLMNNKHVIVEKPISLSTSDSEDLIQTALSNNKRVFCVMQNRYSPPSIWLKSLLNSGTLGNIYMVQTNCYWNRDSRYYNSDKPWKGTSDMDGGTLFTQFSHFIDIMYWLFGDITNIEGKFKDFNHQNLTTFEDSGIINFEFEKGGIGSFNYSTSVYDKNFESSITIIAENGTVKVGGQYMDEVEYCHIKGYEMPELPPSNPPNDYGYYKGSASNHNYVIENVVDTLYGNGRISTTAMEGSKVVNIIEKIYKVRDNDISSL